MVLRLLPVEGVRHVPVVLAGHGDSYGGDERDALVGRAEEAIELHAAGHDRVRVELAEPGERAPRVEEAGVEEVRGGAARLQRELAEAEHILLESELDEAPLVFRGWRHGGSWPRVLSSMITRKAAGPPE